MPLEGPQENMQSDGLAQLTGANIRKSRERAGLSQVDLAQRSGVSKTSISEYESGGRVPNGAALLQLANALAVSTDYLLGRAVAVDGVTTLPRGWVLVDNDRVDRILAADTPERLDHEVEWQPIALQWGNDVPQNYSLFSAEDYADVRERVERHLLENHGDLEQRWLRRFDESRSMLGGLRRWLRRDRRRDC